MAATASRRISQGYCAKGHEHTDEDRKQGVIPPECGLHVCSSAQ
ncbi:hypothetical protein PAMC26510_07435 [Caballeronia sordidicola]|uniref:Uncharacterized protein n=1 Tax=Caballeronia sordidicola TaxID=196367 RepID=A0A242N4E1_CABSO|nr:hypothetical protein PAMC26510_07435 [Caballeronia sordidicola]